MNLSVFFFSLSCVFLLSLSLSPVFFSSLSLSLSLSLSCVLFLVVVLLFCVVVVLLLCVCVCCYFHPFTNHQFLSSKTKNSKNHQQRKKLIDEKISKTKINCKISDRKLKIQNKTKMVIIPQFFDPLPSFWCLPAQRGTMRDGNLVQEDLFEGLICRFFCEGIELESCLCRAKRIAQSLAATRK